MRHVLATCGAVVGLLFAVGHPQASSSNGRAADSKSAGCGFESRLACRRKRWRICQGLGCRYRGEPAPFTVQRRRVEATASLTLSRPKFESVLVQV